VISCKRNWKRCFKKRLETICRTDEQLENKMEAIYGTNKQFQVTPKGNKIRKVETYNKTVSQPGLWLSYFDASCGIFLHS
jgi:hypothetical protein